MNIEAIKAFANTELKPIIEKASEDKKVPKLLLKLPSTEREKLIPLFLEALSQNKAQKWAITMVTKFNKKYQECGLSKELQEKCAKTMTIFDTEISSAKVAKAAKKAKKAQQKLSFLQRVNEMSLMTSTSSSSTALSTTTAPTTAAPVALNKFPEGWVSLAELPKKLENREELETLFHQVKFRTQNVDPNLINKPRHAAQAHKDICNYCGPYDFNRAGKDIDGLFINASLAKIDDRQSYILGICPRSIKAAQDTFDVILKEGTTVLISLHQPHEVEITGAFWENDVLKLKNPDGTPGFTLRDGWSIEKVSEETVQAKKMQKTITETEMKEEQKTPTEEKENDDSKFQIIESKLIARKGKEERTIYHLLYKGWEDHHAAPIALLMNDLLDRKDTRSPSKEAPIWINCHAGAGRTGTVALLDLCRREIKEQLQQGIKLDEIKINPAELLYRIRQERPKQLARAEGFVNVYQCLAEFVASLKK